jgi:hypothetical protein
VAIVPGIEPSSASQIASQIERAISLLEGDGVRPVGDVRIGLACAPRDGSTLESLLLAARERSRAVGLTSKNPPAVH